MKKLAFAAIRPSRGATSAAAMPAMTNTPSTAPNSSAAVVTRATGPRIFPAVRHDFLQSLLVGLFAAAAIVTLVLALQAGGNLAVGSQYAAVAVLLGIVFRREHLWWWQRLDLAGASVAVGLIALG